MTYLEIKIIKQDKTPFLWEREERTNEGDLLKLDKGYENSLELCFQELL